MANFVHVMPLDDVISHEGSPDCVCGPGGQQVETLATREPVGMIYHHHAVRPCSLWEASAEG
ncbi:hypothetical protein [Microtetraspora fusca]|uniref:hypothetical protein n=1 Tax=Microtetraspora fusca TaxID=1997 RepID=UPI000834D54F|nr:hypothetical protein [Microtetraspora fusca]